MKQLETVQRVLMWLSGLPPEKSTSKWMKIAYIMTTVSVISIDLMAIMCSTVFIYRNVNVDLETALFSLFHNVSSCSVFYEVIAMILLRYKLMRIFEGLAKIYEESKKQSQSKRIPFERI